MSCIIYLCDPEKARYLWPVLSNAGQALVGRIRNAVETIQEEDDQSRTHSLYLAVVQKQWIVCHLLRAASLRRVVLVNYTDGSLLEVGVSAARKPQLYGGRS